MKRPSFSIGARASSGIDRTARHSRSTRTLLVSFLVGLGLATTATAQEVVMIDLGTLGGRSSSATALNQRGHVVGYSDTLDGGSHAFLWTSRDGMIDLGTLGGDDSRPNAVNENSDVVGVSYVTGGGARHAFWWSRVEGMVDIGTLGGLESEARDVNDAGQVVGGSSVESGFSHAFLWTREGGLIDLGTLGGRSSSAVAVNNRGEVVGTSDLPGDSTAHAFVWTAAQGMVDLGTLPGDTHSAAVDVNDQGQVVGQSSTGFYRPYSHPFSWSPGGKMLPFGPTGSYTTVAAVSETGQVVGRECEPYWVCHPFSWTAATGMSDPSMLGGMRGWAADVNASGQIVGVSENFDFPLFRHSAFVWTITRGVVDLGSFGGPLGESGVAAVNDNGQVAGDSSTPGRTAVHATMWLLPVDVSSAIGGVIRQINAYGLPHGLPNALTVKLEAATASWTRGRDNAAANQLGAFIQHVHAQSGKALTLAQADSLVERAQQIIDAINMGRGTR